jgi:hypothetical protein
MARRHAHPEGAIAQLGERLICIQEVVGSIPSGSTIRPLSGVLKRFVVCFVTKRSADV